MVFKPGQIILLQDGYALALTEEMPDSKGFFADMWRGILTITSGATSHVEECAIKVVKPGKAKELSLKREVHFYNQLKESGNLKLLYDEPISYDGRELIVLSLGSPVTQAKIKMLSNEQKIKYLLDIADDVIRIHKEELVHCDIKLENTICIKGQYCLCDYGCMKVKGTRASINERGRRYMPPECQGKEETETDFSLDVFYFGWLIYETFEGVASNQTYPPIIEYSNKKALFPLDVINGIIEDALSPLPKRPTMNIIKERLEEAERRIIDDCDIDAARKARQRENRLQQIRKKRYQCSTMGSMNDAQDIRELLMKLVDNANHIEISMNGESFSYVPDPRSEKRCLLNPAIPLGNASPIEIDRLLICEDGTLIAFSNELGQLTIEI